jgi:hypothetical protein
LSSFAEFWQTAEERGIRGWLLHRHRYQASDIGCFPSSVAVSRLDDILTAAGIAVATSVIAWIAFQQIVTV